MPEYLDESKGEKLVKEIEGRFIVHEEIFNEVSPTSPLSAHSPPLSTQSPISSTLSPESDSLDLAIDGAVDTSIEQLYHNVCEMQSSDHSPSRLSFLSYGEESRIDSELRFLAGVNNEIKKEAVAEENGGDINISPPKETPPEIGLTQPDKATLRSKTFGGRPPKNSKVPKKFSSMKNGGRPSNGEPGYLGPYLLKQARDIMVSGDGNPGKALELALRAMKSFEVSSKGKPNLDLVMSLHVLASIYCKLGRHAEAVPVLERSIDIPVMDLGHNHALAKFAGCMQLGDTYAMMGRIEDSLMLYNAGLEIQQQVLGEKDTRFGETCRYVAEAHVQALQFDEAEKLCLIALQTHKANGLSGSLAEAADRRLLGLICDSKGDYEGALEHYVLASMSMAENERNADVAAIDCEIGDAYLSLMRYDEAIFSYQKGLNTFKATKGENHSSVASVFVRLADLYNKIGKFGESKSYCENAVRIYAKVIPGSAPEEVASGLVKLSAIYESMNEPDRALELLQKAVAVYGNGPEQQSTIAGIEAQMGVLYYILGSYSDSYNSLKNAILKFRAIGERKSALFSIVLNQMGLACVQLLLINEAADLFEEAKSILEAECGPYHADTLGVYSNLAGTYDAMGRTDDAIEILEYVVEMREEKLGMSNPDVENEKCRLFELIKEAGIMRSRNSRSSETLLVNNNSQNIRYLDFEVS